MSKKRSPRPAATEARAWQNPQDHFIAEFDDCQAEKVWQRDFRRICIGAAVVLILILLGVI